MTRCHKCRCMAEHTHEREIVDTDGKVRRVRAIWGGYAIGVQETPPPRPRTPPPPPSTSKPITAGARPLRAAELRPRSRAAQAAHQAVVACAALAEAAAAALDSMDAAISAAKNAPDEVEDLVVTLTAAAADATNAIGDVCATARRWSRARSQLGHAVSEAAVPTERP